MILSRLWYVVVGLVVGVLSFGLFLAHGMYNRAVVRQMGEALAGDTQVVASFLRDDARKRSTALITISLDDDVRAALAKSSGSPDKVPQDAKDKAKAALRKQKAQIPADQAFDALFAVDQAGRVVAQDGYDASSGIDGFELGGYPIVADALHGWVRDDAWVFGNVVYRVVARPVETDSSAPPAGAIVGARAVNDSFARDVAKRTGAAVGFFIGGVRVASGAPEGVDVSQLDSLAQDLSSVQAEPAYKDKGTSDVRVVHGDLGVVYAKLPGEAWDLGAGYVVARSARLLATPKSFLDSADDKDKQGVPLTMIALVAAGIAVIGIVFTLIEHTQPLAAFHSEAGKVARGEQDQLSPSKLRGAFRKVALVMNDGIEKVAIKGGAPRRAADLEQVLGPIPTQPAMSAFSFPGDKSTPAGGIFAPVSPDAPPPADAPPASMAKPPVPKADVTKTSVTKPVLSKPGAKPPKPPPRPGAKDPDAPPASEVAPMSVQGLAFEDEATVVSQTSRELVAATKPDAEDAGDWHGVYEEFLRTKQQCGEPTDALTYEKFEVTLRKNRDSIIARYGCKRVKFTVYVKEGRAALKASPVKD